MPFAAVTHSAEETAALGRRLGGMLGAGDFVALVGELGSGKTQFVRGVAAGLGVDPAIPVTSPTYTLMNEYAGRVPFYHFDLYRLGGGSDLRELGFDDFFYGEGACLVEWAERLQGEIPAERLTVSFFHGGDDQRRLEFAAHGERYEAMVRRLQAEQNKKMF